MAAPTSICYAKDYSRRLREAVQASENDVLQQITTQVQALHQIFGRAKNNECRSSAQVRLATWRRDYNEERLHSSLKYVTPNEFAARWAEEAASRSMAKAALGS